MNQAQLIEIAQKVFVNRDQETKREDEKKARRKMEFLAAALQGQPLASVECSRERRGGRTGHLG